MTSKKANQIKDIRSLISATEDNEDRYLSGKWDVLRAIVENPGTDPKKLISHLALEAKSRSTQVIQELKQLLLELDPLQTVAQLAFNDTLRRGATSASDSYGSDAMIEFITGIVTSLPAEDVTSRLGRKFNLVKFNSIENLLREFANLQNTIRFDEISVTDPGDIGLAQLLLKMESQFDRTEGYLPHIERICRGIFQPISNMAYEKLGFHPSIVLELAQAQSKHQEQGFDSTRDRLREAFDLGGRFQSIPEKQRTALAYYFLLVEGAPSIEDALDERLSEEIDKSIDEVRAALDALSTDLGAQPGVERLNEPLLIQNKPIIRLPDGRRLWPRPIDFPHEALNWFHELSKADKGLQEAFNKSRQAMTPKLTYEVFKEIFGSTRTHLEPTYQADEKNPDLDVLVLPPESALLIEVKAAHFTSQGRAGLTLRVKTKIEELFLDPLAQLTRAEKSVKEAPESWRGKNGKRIELMTPKRLVKLVVTLENVDPISSWAQLQNLREMKTDWNVWPISLSNLMMVADILTNPHEFYSYAIDRVKTFQNGQPLINMESDILSHWCSERNQHFNFDLAGSRILSYGSDDMNEYFTYAPLGLEVDRPAAKVPREIIEALDLLYENKGSDWFACVTQIYSVSNEDWSGVEKSLRARRGDTTNKVRTKRRANRLIDGIEVGGGFVVSVREENSENQVETQTNIETLVLTMKNQTVVGVDWLGMKSFGEA